MSWESPHSCRNDSDVMSTGIGENVIGVAPSNHAHLRSTSIGGVADTQLSRIESHFAGPA